MAFSDRHKARRAYPTRDVYEEAPDRLRALLLKIATEQGAVAGYRVLCDVLGQLPDSQIWGASFAAPEVSRMVESMEWYEVFDALEELAETRRGQIDDVVNEAFARCGLAYEMVDGQISLLDEVGNELNLAGNEDDATMLLTGRFRPVYKQYEKALSALHGRPADLEKAVAEAFGALEAVVHIVTGTKDFGAAVDKALADRTGLGALSKSLKSMYGYASQVPGARHGRHAEPDLTFAEARLVVRTTGSAIAYLIETQR